MRLAIPSLILLAIAIAFGGCATRPPRCPEMRADSSRGERLERVTSPEAALAELLTEMELESLPQAAQEYVRKQMSDDFDRLVAKKQPADGLWRYRLEKCCGWYTEGFRVLRGCETVAELVTSDEM